MILLADFGLQYGMPKRSKRILEDILPQVCSIRACPLWISLNNPLGHQWW